MCLYRIKELNLGVQISSELLDEIRQVAVKHLPNEFGGILLGSYHNKHKLATIEKIISPKSYKSSPTNFEREPNGLNTKIKREFIKSEGKTIYLGEWHSHPDMMPIPSDTDIRAMQSIANSTSIMVDNPIMLIVGIGKTYFEPKFHVIIKNKIYSYE